MGFTKAARWLRTALAALVCAALAHALLAPAAAASGGDAVDRLDLSGVINPLSARYVERGLEHARSSGARAVLLVLDTPGGLETSMRSIAAAVLGSPVPVIVYVAPPGARAASAGMFITHAGSVAAMAPGPNNGAAHPVALGGGADARADKAVEDAAALARSIAEARGKNAAWAERAVRESASITASEAVDLGVVDLVARDADELLARVDGRVVDTVRGPVTLETAGARLVRVPMSPSERLLATVADPNLAFLLLSVGLLGLLFEVLHPGAALPGLVGGVCLVVALVALGMLPTNWAGVLLVAIAAGLVVADVHVGGLGALSLAALVAFVLGAMLLFEPWAPVSPAAPRVRVSPWLLGGATAAMGGFIALVARALARARRAPVATGIEALVGRVGFAATDLDPRGFARVDGERWSAIAEDEGAIRAGEPVQVVRVEGVTLHVLRA